MIQPKLSHIERYIDLISSDIINLLENPRFERESSISIFYRYLSNDRSRIQNMFNAYSNFILDSIVDESMNHANIKSAFAKHHTKYRNHIIQKQMFNSST